MYDLIKKSVDNDDDALELAKSEKNIVEIVDAISELSLDDVEKLGTRFKKFPIGCDLHEVVIGTCASDLEKIDLLGNCMLSNMIGASIHICAYAFSDIGEKYNQRGVDLIEEVYNATDVPLDLDHFGKYGAMRFPKEIVNCSGECYNKGPGFTGCPQGRIHQRLVEKEKEEVEDIEKWIKFSSSVAVNLTSEQGGEDHSAPIKEAKYVAELAKKHGKGLETIMFVGDGYDDLITGFERAIDFNADIFVVEGGPFNLSESPNEAFAKAIVASRILCPGKVVATNGAYESECRVGLRSGLNIIITGFPNNHHGYMAGYSPKTAQRGNFGLPRVIKIMNEEIKDKTTRIPIQRDELISLSQAVKIAGENNIYPNKIGYFTIGDAHWGVIKNSKLYRNVDIENSLNDIYNHVTGSSVALFGGRFLSWVIAKELDKKVDEIIISDKDRWVERVTVNHLQEELNATIIHANSNDVKAYKATNKGIITSTIEGINKQILKKVPNALKLV
ncbi:MAG: 5,10-methenyltetrahydromethanopterin hydrogenase cofactor biosynthesis protein HmdC [Methanobrevibacter sp.]|jgi:5,10-methenyltetrahydromethanopterin hydrogenase cofactor biosynthesis protein HmdC|nr:5,10-methenyltetrahydromethanopterin hydrogenase cofactor biosynthesis protein HmdC [Candidatus Methanovirga basalitermitum]